MSTFIKVRNIFNYATIGYSGAIVGREEKLVLQFIAKNRISCVLAEFGQTACAINAICKSAGIPLFVFFHGQDASVAGRKLKNKFSYWRMGRYATKVFVATKFFAEKVAKTGIPKGKIFIAPYGLEVEKFFPSENRDLNLIVAVGRMVAKKAPHLTVESFFRVQLEVPDARMQMIGDGPLLGQAKDKAKELGIDDKIIFHGSKDHSFVKDKVAQAAIFVQHSLTAPNGDTESLGVSLLEAMACEVPVVTTRHNGFVETVEDGVTGFLVEERDVDAMAKRMILLLKNKDLRIKMGKSARQRVLRYYESKKQAKALRELMEL